MPRTFLVYVLILAYATMSCAVAAGGVAHSASAIIAQAAKGSHVLKIDGYSRTKRLGNGEHIKSEPFDIGGHRWHIKYYPHGYRAEDAGRISFYLCLDHNNAKDADASFTLSLLDAAGELVPSYSFGDDDILTFKPDDDDGWPGWGYPSFIRHDVSGRRSRMFAAHRLVLGARSSVFMAELYGPMKEKSTSHVRIDDMEPRVFKMDHKGGDMTIAMVQHLLVAADRYGLERLKLMCENKLCECINTSMAMTTLVLAEQHGCKGLKEACFKFLKAPGHLKMITEGDALQHLTSSCPSLLSELLVNVCTLM